MTYLDCCACPQAILELDPITAAAGVEPQLLHQQAMAHFELWLLQAAQLFSLQQPGASVQLGVMARCMQMLASAAEKGAALAADGYSVQHFEQACAEARRRLE